MTMTARKVLVRATIAAALALATTACAGDPAGSAGGSGGDPVTFITAAPTLGYATTQVMKSKDFATANGLNLNYQASGSSSTTLISATLSGQAQFGAGGFATILDAINAGSDLVVVACTSLTTPSLVLRKDVATRIGASPSDPVQNRISALKGLTIATTQEGSATNQLLRQIVSHYGLNPDRDLRIVGVQDPSAVVGGVKQGQFDGGYYSPGVLEQNIADGEAEIYASGPNGDFDELFKDAVFSGVFAKRSWADQHPTQVDQLLKALGQAQDFIDQHPAEAGKVLKNDWFPKLDQNVFDIAWKSAQKSGIPGAKCTRTGVEKAMQLGGKNYSKINYDKIVVKQAQA
ncbi:ABC transporter substrate-binding protein [Dactylosporangium sp. NPDC000555]|uniref:ABC transporter substrate-binding protein n=1 Tax=Dactylosporangium sp. NPDC000555 TaxID=3154260 RepID=UPI003326794B